MGLSERTTSGIEACYDALLVGNRWPSALQRLGESVGAESCTFASCYERDERFRIPRSEGHEDFAQLWLANQAHAPDPHTALGRQRSAPSCLLEEDVTSAEQRRILPYFHETARPGNRDWWALARFAVEGRGWGFALYRGDRHGPFTLAEARIFIQVSAHLARLIGLAEKFARRDATGDLDLLQRLGTAAIVLDAGGVARQLNPLAEALLGPDFGLARGRPVATDRESNRRLRSMIASALAGRAVAPAVVHRDGAPWLLAEAMPVTRLGSDFFAAGRLVLLLTDLTRRDESWALGAGFGLTPAEARLASIIAAGIGIDEAAATLGVSRETVRTQLKAAFAKTGTRSQAALAALAGRMRS
jgi:DNA-binding CsgD family transcriptional regulator